LSPLAFLAASWQRLLPWLIPLMVIAWFAVSFKDPASSQSFFILLLGIYMVHQVEEHLWPGGFRSFANAEIFHSGRDDWPLTKGGVALVNIGYVWLPCLAAAMFPQTLYLLGAAWMALTFVNALSHIATSVRLHKYNPGLCTSIVLFLPLTGWFFTYEYAARALDAANVAGLLVAGILLHVPITALFVIPFRLGSRTPTALIASK
jgi:Protein of unknown function with HXXEE motif